MPPLIGDLHATQTNVDDLTDALAKCKQGTKLVRVPAEAVQNIFMDYSKLLRVLDENNALRGKDKDG